MSWLPISSAGGGAAFVCLTVDTIHTVKRAFTSHKGAIVVRRSIRPERDGTSPIMPNDVFSEKIWSRAFRKRIVGLQRPYRCRENRAEKRSHPWKGDFNALFTVHFQASKMHPILCFSVGYIGRRNFMDILRTGVAWKPREFHTDFPWKSHGNLKKFHRTPLAVP